MTMARTQQATVAPAGVPPTDAGYTSVLVPLDGSDTAERALAPGRRLATQLGAALHVVVSAVPRDELWWYENYLDKLRAGGLTAHMADQYDPAAAIVATARQLQPCLVCLATHGRSRSGSVVGSTLASVVDNQPLEEREPPSLTSEAEVAIHFRPFRHFMDNDLSSNDRIKAVVLELTGQELCPAHQQAITEFREYWSRRDA